MESKPAVYTDGSHCTLNEIRVLEILPFEEFSETINTICRIISLASGTSTETYVALSYTWGKPNDTSYICINGHKHKVTPNLESALRHLRGHKAKVVIWVDAVCVNQNDIPERDTQLKMMADIYRKAEKGLSWLGEESDDSSLAFRMIQRWASLGIPHGMSRGELSAFFKNTLQDEIFMPRSVTALKKMLQRPYWKRVWILQEVTLPPIVTMQCGHELLPFSVVGVFAYIMQDIQKEYHSGFWSSFVHDLIPTDTDTISLIQWTFYRMLKSVDYEKDEAPHLLHHLYASISLESTDPRDQIFALLGLPGFEKYRSLVRPSYIKSTSEVFSEAARIMIEEENNLDAIVFARSLRLCCSNLPLPSWVPDWTARGTILAPLVHFRGKSHDPVAKLSDYVNFSADGQILSVTGLLHDEVSVLKGRYSTAPMKSHGEWEQLSDLKDNSLPNGLTVSQAVFL
ncbi:uncharacterized protein EAE97_001957 [Botrytis byssoidea]|uniref:Heterokaryon incompatibility domain-containing protein n=1 Tax=Botrytis byssoidea TaxID=139641 RepID=A0A9P5ISV0_9HELO|nr:uncharacterized protein EAE97_001957 [Botrytis byssoidea]KAF7952460.1 hypothetical protein EAE97_001957 [Botrytis byssoidea]